jgi:uncharacterized protein (DUF1778 family)
MSAISLRLPNSIHRRVRDVAKHDGVSINQFISVAVSEKISALEAEDYLEARANRGSMTKFHEILSRAPNVEPAPEDRI